MPPNTGEINGRGGWLVVVVVGGGGGGGGGLVFSHLTPSCHNRFNICRLHDVVEHLYHLTTSEMLILARCCIISRPLPRCDLVSDMSSLQRRWARDGMAIYDSKSKTGCCAECYGGSGFGWQQDVATYQGEDNSLSQRSVVLQRQRQAAGNIFRVGLNGRTCVRSSGAARGGTPPGSPPPSPALVTPAHTPARLRAAVGTPVAATPAVIACRFTPRTPPSLLIGAAGTPGGTPAASASARQGGEVHKKPAARLSRVHVQTKPAKKTALKKKPAIYPGK